MMAVFVESEMNGRRRGRRRRIKFIVIACWIYSSAIINEFPCE
jgi:hypothetical protein